MSYTRRAGPLSLNLRPRRRPDIETIHMSQVWKIAPGVGAEDWGLFRKHGCIGLGWLVGSDYRDYGSEGEFLAALEEEYGKGVPGASAGSAKMIWRFVHEVKLRHVVVANERYNR